MVDSRKSAQAKRQLRTRNGEFAEEDNKSLPSGDTLTAFERKRLNNAMLAAETNIIMDPDVADYSQYAASRLDELVARPAKPGETDDMPSSSPISVTTLWAPTAHAPIIWPTTCKPPTTGCR